jgi:hypothetical protein
MQELQARRATPDPASIYLQAQPPSPTAAHLSAQMLPLAHLGVRATHCWLAR